MRPNPHETANLVTFTKKSLMENFIFCAVRPFSRVLRILKKLSNCHY